MSTHPAPGSDEAPVRDLLRLAGRRPEPAAFRMARVRAAVEAEWRQSVARRSRRRLWWAPAAVLLLALVLWGRAPSRQPATPPAPQPLAKLARITGVVRLSSAGSSAQAVAAGAPVGARMAVDTIAGGRAALAFDTGTWVRIDRGSKIVLEATNRLTLERGRVYVDSGDVTPAGDGLQITTPSGVVREIGTVFEVEASGTFVQVRVREGAVRIQRPHTSLDVAAAEAVKIDADGFSQRRAVARSAPEWSWIDAITPPFTIEGATLESFLRWVSREQGWGWQFRDAAAARYAKDVVLHGTIDGLTPSEALEAVLPTCGMTAELRGARLIVGLASR